MREFKWTKYRLDMLRSRVRAYNAAITRRERELGAAGMGELKASLPPRVTVDEVRSRVRNVNDFRRIVGYRSDAKRGRTSELTRILKRVNPHALDIVESEGARTTVYSRNQRRLDERAVRRMRRDTYEDLGLTPEDVRDMAGAEAGITMDDTDLAEDDMGVPDDSTVDVDPDTLGRWRDEDARRKRDTVRVDAMYHVYRSTWVHPNNFHSSMSGYNELLNALDWLADNRPRVLNAAFNSGVDELDPDFITDSGRNNPYINIDYEVRHHRAVRYIVGLAERNGYHVS